MVADGKARKSGVNSSDNERDISREYVRFAFEEHQENTMTV